MDRNLEAVSRKWGINFMGVDAQLQRTEKERGGMLAMDAQPELITMSSSGIPAFLSTFIDPKVIEVLVAPNKATKIVGEETKKGDWTLETAMFPIVESTGMVSSYGDYSMDGIAGANVNWVQRQSYTYQVITQWGERELDKMGLARIDWANRQRIASVSVLDKFQNKSYFFGISGLANYGLLNDPSLSAPIAPLSQGAGLVTWAQKATDALNGAVYIYDDILALYKQLVSQAEGLVDMDMDSPMTLVMSPISQVYLKTTNVYKATVKSNLQENFPNLRFETAPEYNTASGEFVQLILDEMKGQRTATTAFTEKLRAHPIIVQESSFRQKTSAGTWGTIISRPFLIQSLIGV
jgi:hypothetical protein